MLVKGHGIHASVAPGLPGLPGLAASSVTAEDPRGVLVCQDDTIRPRPHALAIVWTGLLDRSSKRVYAASMNFSASAPPPLQASWPMRWGWVSRWPRKFCLRSGQQWRGRPKLLLPAAVNTLCMITAWLP